MEIFDFKVGVGLKDPMQYLIGLGKTTCKDHRNYNDRGVKVRYYLNVNNKWLSLIWISIFSKKKFPNSVQSDLVDPYVALYWEYRFGQGQNSCGIFVRDAEWCVLFEICTLYNILVYRSGTWSTTCVPILYKCNIQTIQRQSMLLQGFPVGTARKYF